jgi:hypothetical protein
MSIGELAERRDEFGGHGRRSPGDDETSAETSQVFDFFGFPEK